MGVISAPNNDELETPNTKSELIDLKSSAEQTNERSEMSCESTEWTKFTSELKFDIKTESKKETAK